MRVVSSTSGWASSSRASAAASWSMRRKEIALFHTTNDNKPRRTSTSRFTTMPSKRVRMAFSSACALRGPSPAMNGSMCWTYVFVSAICKSRPMSLTNITIALSKHTRKRSVGSRRCAGSNCTAVKSAPRAANSFTGDCA